MVSRLMDFSTFRVRFGYLRDAELEKSDGNQSPVFQD